MQCTGIAPAARWAGVLVALVLTFVPASPAAAETGKASASARLLIPAAGWHGRPIRQPHRHHHPGVGRPPPRRLGGRPGGARHRRAPRRTARRASARSSAGSAGSATGRARSTASSASVPAPPSPGSRSSTDSTSTGARRSPIVRHLRDRVRPSAPGTEDHRAAAPRETPRSWDAFRTLVTPTPGAAQPGEAGTSPWWLAGAPAARVRHRVRGRGATAAHPPRTGARRAPAGGRAAGAGIRPRRCGRSGSSRTRPRSRPAAPTTAWR